MHLDHWLAVWSALALLAGGLILAISLDRLLAAYDLSLQALELTVHSIAEGGAIPVVTGTDQHRLRGKATARTGTRVGAFLLLVAALLAIGSVWANAYHR